MRKLLLATCVSVILSLPAHAQVATFDASNALGQAKSFLQDIKSYAQQLQSYTLQFQQYFQEAQTAEQALNIANGLIHNPTNLGGYMSLAGLAGVNLQSSLPVNPYALMGLTSGYAGIGLGGLMGKLSGVTSLVNGNMGVNNISTCTVASFACQLQTQRQQAAAGQEAAAQTIMADMDNHKTALTALKTRALASPDAKDAADLANQIQIESAAIQSDAAELQAAQSMANAQQTVFNNRSSEWMKSQNTPPIEGTVTAQAPGG